jgi:hypothetical protein
MFIISLLVTEPTAHVRGALERRFFWPTRGFLVLQVITTTTLVIVMFTVWVFGGGTVTMMELLRIPYQSDKTDDFQQVEVWALRQLGSLRP